MNKFALKLIAGALVSLSLVLSVLAGEGHDHGDAPAAGNSSGPKRLPDGSVFLPKPAQHQIGARTIVVTTDDLPRSIELAGKVIMDPNAGGKVQALVAGRISPGERGLPSVGQAVKKGDILAYITPSSGVGVQVVAHRDVGLIFQGGIGGGPERKAERVGAAVDVDEAVGLQGGGYFSLS